MEVEFATDITMLHFSRHIWIGVIKKCYKVLWFNVSPSCRCTLYSHLKLYICFQINRCLVQNYCRCRVCAGSGVAHMCMAATQWRTCQTRSVGCCLWSWNFSWLSHRSQQTKGNFTVMCVDDKWMCNFVNLFILFGLSGNGFVSVSIFTLCWSDYGRPS